MALHPKPSLNSYLFAEKIGCGSFASVYKAYNKTGIKEIVAVKCVLKSTHKKDNYESLVSEIRILKECRHENIVQLVDFQWDTAYIYLILEYCGGGDLSRFIRQKRCLPDSIVRRFLQQLAMALQFLRSRNISHMDLKPQNVLLTSSVNPLLKIADFGLSQYLKQDELVHEAGPRGSPLYMAPEVMLRGAYVTNCDLWSVGVILFECLYGKPPFSSATYDELLLKIQDTAPVPIPDAPVVRPECHDLLCRLLQRDPSQRMNFLDFFNHAFVDLDHAPNPQCIIKANRILREAISSDEAGRLESALEAYEEALEYFVPAVSYERNPQMKKVLRSKINQLFVRAEHLCSLLDHMNTPLISEEEVREICEEIGKLRYEWSTDAASNAFNQLIRFYTYLCKNKLEDTVLPFEASCDALMNLLKEESKNSQRYRVLFTQINRSMDYYARVKQRLQIAKCDTRESENAVGPTQGPADTTVTTVPARPGHRPSPRLRRSRSEVEREERTLEETEKSGGCHVM